MSRSAWSASRTRRIEKFFILSAATLFVASTAAIAGPRPSDAGEKMSKTLRKRVVVKKADDEQPVPNGDMGGVDPATLEAIEDRWQHLSSTINRGRPFNPQMGGLATEPEDIRPWAAPTDTLPLQGADPLQLETNGTPSAAAMPGFSSVVNEPSVAAVGDYVFYTANWYAASSTDGGANWTLVNPFSGPFPEPAGESFCCNQQVHHDEATNTLFWLQQLIPASSSDNGTQRVNVDRDSNGTWDCFYDVTPQDAEFPEKSFPDFPDLSVSNGHLFVTSNIFPSGPGDFLGAFAARLPLSEIAACNNAMVDFHTETDFGSFRTTQGAEDTMYFADLESADSIRVWTWRDADPAPTSVTRTVNAFLFGTRDCADPAGDNWCEAIESRIQGAAVAGNRVAFIWVAEENPGGGFPFPYTQGVILDASDSLAVIEQPLIWSNDAAWIHPSLAANASGGFGGTVLWGGGTFFPRCSAFLVDDQNDNTWSPLEHEVVIAGEGGTDGARTGDFLSTRVYSPNNEVYAGSCFAFPTSGVSESRYVLFGRASDFASVEIFADGFENGIAAWSSSSP